MQRAAKRTLLRAVGCDLLVGCPKSHEEIIAGGCPLPPGSYSSATSELMKGAKSLIGSSSFQPLTAWSGERDRPGWIVVLVPLYMSNTRIPHSATLRIR